jgi:hypothetical protein
MKKLTVTIKLIMMLNKIILPIIIFCSTFSFAQKSSEQFPVFPSCEANQSAELEACFYNEVQSFVFKNFKTPASDSVTNTTVTVLFEVTTNGTFKVQYVDAINEDLVNECQRVFAKLPIVKPATYNGIPTYSKYTIRIAIPLQNPEDIKTDNHTTPSLNQTETSSSKSINSSTKKVNENNKELTEYDNIVYNKFENPQFKSNLNIPFSHSYYAQFDDAMNQVGANNHTASKPYTYTEVIKYYDINAENQKISKNKTSWLGKKLWDENLVSIQGENYWFTMNPILNLQVGKSSPSELKYTYVNTRGIQVNAGLGKQINFTTTIYESQGRFADYYNNYATSIKPSGGNPAIIPGIGIAKDFKTDAFDFPQAEANLSFTPSKIFNLQLGYGRNFIGDGYRSLLMSDGASPYPFFKINTTFWKIKYTNTYMWLKDVRDEVTLDKTYATKYVANHYLSWNVTKKFNLGFFESVVWSNQNNRGFDASFVNPIIFYRAVEFASSSRSGNALLGLTAKYKWNNQVNFYGQFLLDEFSLSDIKAGQKSWKNKFGYQLGAKYFNAFNIKNLLFQLEYNHVRPYVYAHSNALTNYGHNNQSLGHNWGGNFQEVVAIARYHKGRYFADAKFTAGVRGLDFNTATDSFNYGSNIYLNYDDNRPFDTGVKVGQGNKTNIFIADIQAGYLINPQTNMKLFGSLIYRNFNPATQTATTFKESTTWLSIGLRCDIFNWYFDY